MEKNMENNMEVGAIWGFLGCNDTSVKLQVQENHIVQSVYVHTHTPSLSLSLFSSLSFYRNICIVF